jgi:hypothetical protein
LGYYYEPQQCSAGTTKSFGGGLIISERTVLVDELGPGRSICARAQAMGRVDEQSSGVMHKPFHQQHQEVVTNLICLVVALLT